MKTHTRRHGIMALAVSAVLVAAACGKDTGAAGGRASAATDQEPAADEADAGRTIDVAMFTDSSGSYFRPNEIEAKRGDIIRFTLKVGVHNVHFLPDSNPGKTGLPPASDMLQLPGQTYDLKVDLGEGRYYFQCDPHAALGMVGHLKIED